MTKLVHLLSYQRQIDWYLDKLSCNARILRALILQILSQSGEGVCTACVGMLHTVVVISQTISWVSQVRLATVARISVFIE